MTSFLNNYTYTISTIMDNIKLSKRNKALFTIKALSTKPLHCLDLDNIKLWLTLYKSSLIFLILLQKSVKELFIISEKLCLIITTNNNANTMLLIHLSSVLNQTQTVSQFTKDTSVSHKYLFPLNYLP